jgi:hypothetical protein
LDDELGRVAYTAYCERQGWKSFNGDQLPVWDSVRLDIKLAWIAAAVSAVEHWRIHTSGYIDTPGKESISEIQ